LKRPTYGWIIAFGTLILFGSLLYWGFSAVIANPASAKLPKSLAGLPLTTATYGTDAVAEITRLHQEDFSLSSGAMGMYGANNEITLWIAGLSENSKAGQMVDAMNHKIAQGGSPFIPSGERRIKGRTIYQLDGMGQKHFYFQSGDLVLWLAADPLLAESAIQQLLEAYP
jgi:hypothetical protein